MLEARDLLAPGGNERVEPEKREKASTDFLWNGIKSNAAFLPHHPIASSSSPSSVMDLSMIGEILDQDPYLAYQPAFVHSLPIQLFVNAITITLLCVLFIHLLCQSSPLCRSIYQHIPDPPSVTTQYHYPLAPLNYCLQFLSIILVLTSVLIKCVIILNACGDQGDVWPYDLIYVAVTIPPTTWSMGRDAAWFLLQALNMGLANVGVSGNINPDTLTWVARSRMSNS